MTDTAPRHSRRGLAVPFLIVGVLLAAWTGWWFWLTDQVETRLTAQVEVLRQDGWTITHDPVSTTGWPFRTRVSMPQADILAPSGHGVAAPELVAEASSWNPGHWVVVVPDGLTLTRADKGRIAIAGDGLRFSISHLRDRFPDLRAEMIRPTFTPLEGAEPFPIVSAERIQLETRPHLTDGTASTDELDVLFRLIDARGRPGGPVEGATRQGMLSADVEGTIVGASRLQGMDSAGVFAAWTEAGGRFTAVRGRLKAGDSTALISSDSLSARADGRLQGSLALTAEQPMAAIAGLARSQSGAVNRMSAAGAAAATAGSGGRPVDLVVQFRDGRTWLGPFALAPAPRLF
ncbi:MAG: DUF2125 domain-containing protein [Brevundimonas sp.]|uniref:DUF2125 domain-containing protein n=1 Tax=Brevundimonas sp. TaxID=1871086 RepID=UPI0027233086|nr:DUF2125 domain-containing protein [Brevundimonas sp.]MDO9078422.1 DUF2125 domain-containing protein [Brevundimonas sp.]MDP3081946.1 DUF2125 domain-containing protein [Brevundimonas sp.]MDZ4062621.1 DUF2125 domain-containing protein [Brevundimonas sp.]